MEFDEKELRREIAFAIRNIHGKQDNRPIKFHATFLNSKSLNEIAKQKRQASTITLRMVYRYPGGSVYPRHGL